MTAGGNYSFSTSPSTTRPQPPRPPSRETFWRRAMQKRQDLPVWKESLIIIGVVFFLAVLVRTFLFQAYYIPSSSMSTTIQVGDRVLVNKTTYDFRGPRRGEVVVFRGTTAWPSENTSDGNASMFSQLGSGLGNLIGISQPAQDEFVKRVIGLPGDQVACCDSSGRVLVNGAGVDEPYITPSMNAPIADSPPSTPTCADRNFRPIVVPPGMMFVMGDRRLVSQDSRCNGMIPISNIVGRAVAIIWPSSHWTTFSVPKSFKSIPAPEAAGPARRVPIDAGAADGVLVFPLLSAFGLTARSRGKWMVKRRTLRA